jgi:hypothetical protein
MILAGLAAFVCGWGCYQLMHQQVSGCFMLAGLFRCSDVQQAAPAGTAVR